MRQEFKIKRGDRLPPIRTVLEQDVDGEDVPVDLTGNAGVKFFMRHWRTGEVKVDGADAIVVTAPVGVVEYAWAEDDTDEAASYYAEFVVTFDDKEMTFPSEEGGIIVTVTEDESGT